MTTPNGGTQQQDQRAMSAREPFVRSGVAVEYDTHKFTVDASDVGLPPGVWPDYLRTDLGNRQPLRRVAFYPDNGAQYRQTYGIVVVDICND